MLDINSFSEQISSSSNFGTKTATIYSGSRIVKEDDYWSVDADDSSVPIPIALKLESLMLFKRVYGLLLLIKALINH